MKNKVLATIKKYNMLAKGDNVVVGLSGGADSTALLHLLNSIKEDYNLTITAVHLNHLLRGQESFRDEAFAESFAGNLNIPFYKSQVDIKKIAEQTGKSIEETARIERYRLFNQYAENGKVATAHNLNDSIETVIFNLTRGSGIKGFLGIPPVRDNIVRPLCDITREEIELYCMDNSLTYCTDSTNLESDFSRNKIRLNVVPVLKLINPYLEQTMAKNMDVLRSDWDYLDDVANSAIKLLEVNGRYNLKCFRELHRAIQNRVIVRLLSENSLSISSERVLLITESILKNHAKIELAKGIYFVCEDGYFAFVKADFIKPEEFYHLVKINKDFKGCKIKLNFGKTVDIIPVECKEFENIANSFDKRLNYFIDCGKIDLFIEIRNRKPSDYFYPYGRGVGKSVKKLFNEAKIPPAARDKIVIVESNKEIVWIEGFGASETASVKNFTEKAIFISVKE